MPVNPTTKLNTGAEMPTVGLGTWKSAPGEVEHAVEAALRNGYKHIDTATAYSNEAEVAQGIKASGVPRESFFLTTKLNNPDMGRPKEALEYSLKQLDTPYLDLCTQFFSRFFALEINDVARVDALACTNDQGRKGRPLSTLLIFLARSCCSTRIQIDWLDTWHEMEKLYKAHPDKLKAIGVSNFSVPYLERLLANSEIVPAVNQIELHPSCPQQEVVNFCTSKGIVVTAYSPLGSDNSPLLKNPVVNKIAEKYGVGPGTILISLQANRPNVNVLPKSVKKERIIANFKVIDLTDEEIKELNDISKTSSFRACHPRWTGFTDNLGFTEAV
ncbi:aldo-keto reductase [Moniliophthora roreri]|nr:aldo-keto reductase [Moniliophthora roreri]